MTSKLDTDVVIFGGGCAGLWLLDELRRRGLRAVLLESGRLGGGQTTGSQGILHGGVKYVLKGIFSASADSVRDMPAVWSAARTGKTEPDLSAMRMRSDCCYLWRSDSWQSWAGLIGARAMLEVKPIPLSDADRPPILAACPGQVYRLNEDVIDTTSFAQIMALRNQGSILKIDAEKGLEFEIGPSSDVTAVVIQHPQTQQKLILTLKHLVLTAGGGNEGLRQLLRRPSDAMQRRPLHMVLLRGNLPRLNGHCVDGAKTRVTITSDVDSQGRTVWQVGGQLAEDGVRLESKALIELAQQELSAVLPGWKPGPLEWSTYRIDRAEARTADGSRPNDVQLIEEGNVLTAWPTKLVLAPRLADRVIELIPTDALSPSQAHSNIDFSTSLNGLDWPMPEIAFPPWEQPAVWTTGN